MLRGFERISSGPGAHSSSLMYNPVGKCDVYDNRRAANTSERSASATVGVWGGVGGGADFNAFHAFCATTSHPRAASEHRKFFTVVVGVDIFANFFFCPLPPPSPPHSHFVPFRSFRVAFVSLWCFTLCYYTQYCLCLLLSGVLPYK